MYENSMPFLRKFPLSNNVGLSKCTSTFRSTHRLEHVLISPTWNLGWQYFGEKCLHIGERWHLFCRNYLLPLLSERNIRQIDQVTVVWSPDPESMERASISLCMRTQ